jgi:hypothetical protein
MRPEEEEVLRQEEEEECEAQASPPCEAPHHEHSNAAESL